MKMKESFYSEKFQLKSHPNKKLIKHLFEVKEEVLNILSDNYPNSIGEEETKKIGKIISVSHDFGKSSSYFQKWLKTNERNILNRHGLISSLFGLYLLQKNNFLNISNLKKEELNKIVFQSIKHHHINIKNPLLFLPNESGNRLGFKDIKKIVEDIKKHNKEEVNLMYNKLLETNNVDYIQEFDDFLNNLTTFKSQVRLPQMESSNEKIFFVFNLLYSTLLEADKISAMDIEKPSPTFNPSLNHINQYKKKFENNEFNNSREEICQTILNRFENNKKNYYFSINAPTGSGKTLSMLSLAFKIKNYEKNKGNDYNIIYSLPFVSIIQQNYKEFENVLNSFKDEVTDDILISYHHLADDVYKTKNDENEVKEKDYRIGLFFMKNLESEITVTTFYQLFKSIFNNNKNLLQKYNKFSNSIILIDEIQSIPPYLYEVVKLAFKYLCQELNSYIILSTATQPFLNPPKEYRKTEVFKPKQLLKNSDIPKEEKFYDRYYLKSDLNKKKTEKDIKKIIEKDVKQENINNIMIVLNTIRSTKKLYNQVNQSKILNNYKKIF
ncbi:MAG: CRISPR-associated endonuclease Cas3'' [archaeon]